MVTPSSTGAAMSAGCWGLKVAALPDESAMPAPACSCTWNAVAPVSCGEEKLAMVSVVTLSDVVTFWRSPPEGADVKFHPPMQGAVQFATRGSLKLTLT